MCQVKSAHVDTQTGGLRCHVHTRHHKYTRKDFDEFVVVYGFRVWCIPAHHVLAVPTINLSRYGAREITAE